MRDRAPDRSGVECGADVGRIGNHPRCCQRNVPALRVGKSVPRLFKNARVHLSAVRKGRSASRVASLACRATAGYGLQKNGMATNRQSDCERWRFYATLLRQLVAVWTCRKPHRLSNARQMIHQLLIPQFRRHCELKSVQRTQTRTLHQQFDALKFFAQQFSATASVLDCAARGNRQSPQSASLS